VRGSRWRFARRSPSTFWIVTVLLAVVTGTVVTRLVERAAADAARYGSPRPVAVARHAVEPGDVVDDSDVTVREMPASLVPDGALRSPPVGRVAVAPLLPGQIVVAAQFAPQGLSPVAALLPRGRRAVAVPTGGVAPPLRRGDVVDVFVTVDDADPPTFPVASRALVVATDDDTVTVAVTERELPRVAFAVARGVIAVALADR
jgi:pilus assembly protein CpaB